MSFIIPKSRLKAYLKLPGIVPVIYYSTYPDIKGDKPAGVCAMQAFMINFTPQERDANSAMIDYAIQLSDPNLLMLHICEWLYTVELTGDIKFGLLEYKHRNYILAAMDQQNSADGRLSAIIDSKKEG